MVFLGVHCDNWSDAVTTAKDEAIEYPLTNDVDGQTQKAYGVWGYPTVYVIDRKGIVRFMDPPDLGEAVKQLLDEPA